MTRNAMGQFTNNSTHPSYSPGGLTPMDLSALQSFSSRPAIEQRYTFIDGVRKTTPAERQWRRENNRCMYCAGSGHGFDNCPSANRPRKTKPSMTGALLEPNSKINESSLSQVSDSSESDFL